MIIHNHTAGVAADNFECSQQGSSSQLQKAIFFFDTLVWCNLIFRQLL